ncbi:Aldo/keto reductase [Stereum hirsutum FP-91666 SS1]|uniref:Aldo/keto reductase n=1 Tax=Stereum hirsutum (strain FP-91666) TaxID=721885 RepID=UPI000440A81A|nr:Aldo/keto reductase [Stereum hirsutum FP-91666 SS1]EIM89269.1 Aldo/keto reductase [Stereum hirsutum FP-91666 SS1]
MTTPTLKLNSGYDIPTIAFGTWGPEVPQADISKAVTYAIKEGGYRHIDCAWGYLNEKAVGEGIKRSGIKREELFITSKVWGTYHNRVEESLGQTLAALGTDYLDLYLIHWPVTLNPNGNDDYLPKCPDGSRDVITNWDIMDTWKQMEELVRKGKIRSIGTANFSIPILSSFLPHTTIPPAVHQVELHIYNPDHALVSYCKENGMAVMGYSAMNSDENALVEDEEAQRIAKERGLRGVDVIFGWLVAKNIIAVTLSLNQSNIGKHIDGFVKASNALTAEDIAVLDGIAAEEGVDLGFDNWTAKSW